MISNDIHKKLDQLLKRQLLLKLLNIVSAAYCIAKIETFLIYSITLFELKYSI